MREDTKLYMPSNVKNKLISAFFIQHNTSSGFFFSYIHGQRNTKLKLTPCCNVNTIESITKKVNSGFDELYLFWSK